MPRIWLNINFQNLAEQQYYLNQQIKALILNCIYYKIDWLIDLILLIWLISSKNKYWDNWSVWCNYDPLCVLPSCQFDQSHSQCHSDDSDSVLSQIVGGRIREQSDEVNIDQDTGHPMFISQLRAQFWTKILAPGYWGFGLSSLLSCEIIDKCSKTL